MLKKMVYSYEQAESLYRLTVNLAFSWTRKYYPRNNYKVHGIPLEKVQAFSQQIFFSNLILKNRQNDNGNNAEFENIWNTYPVLTSKEKGLDFGKVIASIARVLDVLKSLFAPRVELGDLQKIDLLILASGRHLEDIKDLILTLNKYHRILIVGKIPGESQRWLIAKSILCINIGSGRIFLTRYERLKLLFRFAGTRWQQVGNNDLLKNLDWRKRLTYLKMEQFPELDALVKLANSIFKRSNPTLVLATSSNDTFAASFCLTAKSLDTPVAEILHGFTSWSIIDRDFAVSDYQLVWGEIPKKLRAGFSKEIRIVGCPFLKKPSMIKVFEKDPYSQIRLLVLVTPPFGSVSIFQSAANEDVARMLVLGLAKLPDNFEVIIRSHPSYSFKNDLKGLTIPKNIKIVDAGKTREVIEDSDVVITQPTTAGFEAILQGKPLMFFDNTYLSSKLGHPFVTSGSAFNVPLTDLARIDRYLIKFLRDPKKIKLQKKQQEKFIRDYCQYFGNESISKILDFVGSFTSG